MMVVTTRTKAPGSLRCWMGGSIRKESVAWGGRVQRGRGEYMDRANCVRPLDACWEVWIWEKAAFLSVKQGV